LVNYGNRNASSNYTSQDIVKSYSCATFTSVFVSLGINKFFSYRTKNLSGGKLMIYNSIAAFFACTSASSLNAYLMR
jgi:hypothetical protein